MLTYESCPRFLDVLALRQLRHRRSSLPSILEDSRTAFKESLREQEKIPSRNGDKESSGSRHPPDTVHPSRLSSSSHKRPGLKPTLSSPDVGRSSQVTPSPKVHESSLHASTPISHEHRRRRISLPNGLEAAVKSPSHALWLPHHGEEHSNEHSAPRPTRHSSHLPTPHTNGHGSNDVSHRHSTSNGHSHHRSASHSHAVHTPRHYEAPLPPHAHEQPHLRGSSHAAPPPVTFTSQQSAAGRPLSQLTTSTHRSSRSSPPEKRTSPLILPEPPMPSPAPSTKHIEPQTPK